MVEEKGSSTKPWGTLTLRGRELRRRRQKGKRSMNSLGARKRKSVVFKPRLKIYT